MSLENSPSVSPKNSPVSDEDSTQDVHIKICDDEKIKGMLELTKLKQQIQVLQGGSRSQPVRGSDTPRPPIHAMNQRNGQINNSLPPRIPVHMLHTRPDNLGTSSTRARIVEKYKLYGGSSRSPEYNNHKSIDHAMLSPPYTSSPRLRRRVKHKPSELERQLNDVRKKFERTRHMESQLGLTPDAGSLLITPCNEAVDIEEQIIERREELGFRRRTFWKSCCGQIIDRRATQFFVQVFIGAGVMIFCMAKIWQAVPLHDCTGEDTTVYFSLLSALVGFYIPSPSMNKQ